MDRGARPRPELRFLVGSAAPLYDQLASGRLSRSAFESRIRAELAAAQETSLADGAINTSPIERLLDMLEQRSRPGWSHAFVTTNWNTILDRVLAAHGTGVRHLNGSIDDPNCTLYTEIDLRKDSAVALGVEAPVWVLAGLSLSSRLDRSLVERLASEKEHAEAGTAWIVVNDDHADVRRTTRA
jgi:hypothetical protein